MDVDHDSTVLQWEDILHVYNFMTGKSGYHCNKSIMSETRICKQPRSRSRPSSDNYAFPLLLPFALGAAFFLGLSESSDSLPFPPFSMRFLSAI